MHIHISRAGTRNGTVRTYRESAHTLSLKKMWTTIVVDIIVAVYWFQAPREYYILNVF